MSGLVWAGGGLWGGATVPDDPAYHVHLAGQGLILNGSGGYERGRAQQFAAKLSTSGTSENDRLGDQQLLINDWSGGEGLARMGTQTNTDRYRRGSGINIYDEDSVVGLGPYMAAPAALQTTYDAITALGVYRSYLMLGRNDGKVYRWDGGTLSLAGDTGKTSGGITAFGTIGGDLYIGNGQDGDVWRWLGENPGSNFASNFTVGAYSGGTVTGVYGLIPDLRFNLTTGFYGARSTNAGLVGQIANTGGTTNPLTDSNTLIAGDASIAVLLQHGSTIVALGVNTSARFSRLYTATNADPLVWTMRAQLRDTMMFSGTILDGNVYLGDQIQGRVWKWDGSNLTLFDQLGSDLAPYTQAITGIAAWRGALWATLRDTDGTIGLRRYKDGAWSRPVTGLTGTNPGPIAVFQDQMHMVTHQTGASKVWRTNGTYAAAGYVESPLQNANLSGTGKLWLGVTVNHSALIASQSVAVQYQLNDTGAWTTLGTSSTVGATSAEFNFASPVTADQIGFKLILTGASAGSSTPLRVFSLAARYLPSPDALWEWMLSVELRGTDVVPMTRADGTPEPLTGEELSVYIKSLVEDGMPVNLTDLDGTDYTVTIEDYTERLLPSSAQVGATNIGWELEGRLQLRQKPS